MQDIIAGKMQEMLTPEAWWNGKTEYAGQACLGMAFDRACRDLSGGEHAALRMRLTNIIRELFPDRQTHDSLPLFNDHRDTTYEDVLLVIKHFGERS